MKRKLGTGVAVVGVGLSTLGVYPNGVRAADVSAQASDELRSPWARVFMLFT